MKLCYCPAVLLDPKTIIILIMSNDLNYVH